MKKLLSLLLCLVTTMGLLSGCFATYNLQTPSEVKPTPTLGVVGPAPTPSAPAWPRTLTDQAGRSVTLNAPAQKIVSGYYISTSACLALGLGDKLVGIEKKMIPLYNLLEQYNLPDLPTVGTAKEFDLEGCLALAPDLVVLPKKLKDAAEALTEHGVAVLLVNPETQEQLVEALALIGAATGTEPAAEALSATYAASAEKLTGLLTPLSSVPPVVYMGGNGSILTTAPKDMYQATLIRLGGGTNAGDALPGDTWTEVSYEQILQMNPDVIVIPSDAAYTAEDVTGDPLLAEVSAVKSGKVFTMPRAFEAWDSPVPSCFLGSEWMMSVLHPELYSLKDLQKSAAAFYQQVYGVTIDTALLAG